MQRSKTKKLFGIKFLALKRVVGSIAIIVTLFYVILVFDIYINTEKLSKADGSLNAFCQNIAHNSNFTKGPVVFRRDKGTLIYRLNPYFTTGGLGGYSPFFIFPHHRTVILTEEGIKSDKFFLARITAHELGHIQGGLKHLGSAKEMERYADDFATKVTRNQP